MSMKPGKYWVGDLCYALLDEWGDVCSITITGNKCLSGEFKLSDGTPFAMYGTAYGDGCYPDQEGRGYPVDSGTIGCISVDYLLKYRGLPNGGHVIDFPHEFETSGEKNGIIHIGHVSIDTGESTSWSIDEDEDEDEDEE